MTRRYDEPVDVRRRDDLPAEFLWRGRLYVVRDVFGSWIETKPWWTASAARPLYGDTLTEARDRSGEFVQGRARSPTDRPSVASAVGAPVRSTPSDTAPAYVAPSVPMLAESVEREVWRVEASPGRLAGPGVYDLGYDESTNRWSLVQVVD